MTLPLSRKSSAETAKAADLAAARRVLRLASDAVGLLADGLDGSFSAALDLLAAVEGRVVVSGMGKSGHIGRKIAATFSSTGTPAQFVHPGEASHGDLGALTPRDALLMLSNSGETAELSALITHAKRFAIPLVGVASNAESALAQAADVTLILPKAPEACPIGMAPTTSTTLMLTLGDALAVALMERKGFSADDFRDLHPAGALGRALIRVEDIMHKGEELPLAPLETPMREVLIVMTAGRFGFAGVAGIVDDKGSLVGVITDGDLRRHMQSGLIDRTAREVMTPSPKTIPPGMLAAEALAYMNTASHKVTKLFVVNTGDTLNRPVGLLDIHDCLRAGLR